MRDHLKVCFEIETFPSEKGGFTQPGVARNIIEQGMGLNVDSGNDSFGYSPHLLLQEASC